MRIGCDTISVLAAEGDENARLLLCEGYMQAWVARSKGKLILFPDGRPFMASAAHYRKLYPGYALQVV